MKKELNLYSLKFFCPEEFIEGVAIIAAQSTSDAEIALKTTGALKDYIQNIMEMVQIPSATYCDNMDEPVVIKEYLFPVN